MMHFKQRLSEFDPTRSREVSMCAVWKKTSWTVLGASYTSSNGESPKGGWNSGGKETAREHRRVASPRAEKVEPKGKEKEKERKVNELSELPE